MGSVTIAELPLAERTSRSPSPTPRLASHFAPSLVLRLRSAEIPLRELGVSASAFGSSLRIYQRARGTNTVLTFGAAPFNNLNMISFKNMIIIYDILLYIFRVCLSGNTIRVCNVSPGCFISSCLSCKELLESDSLSQCCSHAPRSFSTSYRLYFAGNIQIRWDIIETDVRLKLHVGHIK